MSLTPKQTAKTVEIIIYAQALTILCWVGIIGIGLVKIFIF